MAAERTILKARHPAWPRLETEKRAVRRRFADATVEDLLRAGQHLSVQAAALRRAVGRDRLVRP